MCGRYTLSTPGEVLAELFELGLDRTPELSRRYNLAPTQEAPVVLLRGAGAPRTLEFLRWGFIPPWAKEASIGNRMINARAESVADKPAYRLSFRKKRCLVPADGFYEWKPEGKAKQPYLLRRRDRLPFAFAGLWSQWRKPEGALVETFTILTTTPNDLLAGIHDRMPVIVARDDFAAWLDPSCEDAARLQQLLQPAPSAGWEAVAVSRAVNSPAHDAPDCIEPLTA